MLSKWWLSLIKVFALTSGILSLLLVWFFYIDMSYFDDRDFNPMSACSLDTLILLGSIIIIMGMIYFLIIKSQITYRHKEFFIRKYYGESSPGIILILMVETTIYISISMVVSLVFIDQVTPFFNLMTSKNVDLQTSFDYTGYLMILCFFMGLCLTMGLLPSVWNARKAAIDFLQKLPR